MIKNPNRREFLKLYIFFLLVGMHSAAVITSLVITGIGIQKMLVHKQDYKYVMNTIIMRQQVCQNNKQTD